MGLDMYAYVATRAGQQEEYYAAPGAYEDGEWTVPGKTKPRELAYWRKHPNLHGWMEKLAEKKGVKYNTFNGVELELTYEDLEVLELDVIAGTLPGTTGFFFGESADEYYQQSDLEFIKNARAELFMGLKVFYNSSW
jgi:hypothetical protein